MGCICSRPVLFTQCELNVLCQHIDTSQSLHVSKRAAKIIDNIIVLYLTRRFALIDVNGVITWKEIDIALSKHCPRFKQEALEAYISYWNEPFHYIAMAIIKPSTLIERTHGLFYDKHKRPIVFDPGQTWHVYFGAYIEQLAAEILNICKPYATNNKITFTSIRQAMLKDRRFKPFHYTCDHATRQAPG